MKRYGFLILTTLLLWSACEKTNQTTAADTTDTGVVIVGDTSKKIDAYLTKLSQERGFSGGLLIVQGDKKILCKGYGWADQEKKIPFTPNTLASMGSITKAFTAASIMKLVEQGKLAVTDSLKQFFPDIPADKAGITLHQLLTHSSGFQEILQNDGGDYEVIKTADYLQRAFAEPLAFKPGEKAIYTNVGMSILGIIIEQVTGMDYEAFLKQELLDKVGVKRISYCYPALPTDTISVGYEDGKPWGTHLQRFEKAGGGPYWNLKANGGLEASLNDMFHWINGFTHHTVLSEASIDKMFTAQVLEEGYDGQSWFGYGCNVMKSRRGTKMIDNGGSNGIYHARLIRLPEEGVVFYMFTNENALSTDMVLPNVTQLYFEGEIKRDALAMERGFQSPLAQQVYDLIQKPETKDLGTALKAANIAIVDDMPLWEVGQKLMKDQQYPLALVLYKFYTAAFPNIIVAWNDLGDVHLALGDTTAAKKSYQQALKLRPENPRALENLERLK